MTRLIPPPPVIEPPARASADAVVPGGLVYLVPDWVRKIQEWLTGRKPAPTPTPTPVPQPTHADAAAVVAALSGERAARGLSRLAYDEPTAGVAQYWSGWQALHRTMTHGPAGSFATRIWSVRPGTRVGEIVAAGYQDVASVVDGWMNSPPHKAIILGDFAAAGAGIAYASDGTRYDTVDFYK